MAKARKYLRIDEAAATGYLSRPALRQQRLRPTDATPFVQYWQGYGAVRAYQQSACIPMRPARPPTERQLAALALGRARCPRCRRGTRDIGPDGSGALCEQCIASDRDRERRAAWHRGMTQYEASEQARRLLADPAGVVFIDVETTGLHDTAEIIEIAIVDIDGQPIYHSLVRPLRRIPADTSAIHGLYDQDVADAPPFDAIADRIAALLDGRQVCGYNGDFDRRMLRQSGAGGRDWPMPYDVMDLYARWFGEWSRYHQDYTWQKLTAAAAYTGYPVGRAHRAVDDARMTAHVLRAIASDQCPEPPAARHYVDDYVDDDDELDDDIPF